MISVLVDERISPLCERGLMKEGFNVIKLPAHKGLGEAIASHPDSLVFFCEGELFTPCEYCDTAPFVFSDIREYHPNIKLRFTSDTLSAKYPEDCKMNAKVIGKSVFLREKSISPAILDFAKAKGFKIVNTNQGYPGCVCLSVGESLAVTSDSGLEKAISNEGINTLLIENGNIALPPHEYGFIGGASGVFGNKVYFLGNLRLHKNGAEIEKAIRDMGYIPHSLSEEGLADLGGLVFLK